MAEYEVSAKLDAIDFGADGVAAILQNIRTILSTDEFSAPMHRSFGVTKELSGPISVVQARLSARIIEAIRRHEPRAEVVRVTYRTGDPQDGLIIPVVKVRIEDDAV